MNPTTGLISDPDLEPAVPRPPKQSLVSVIVPVRERPRPVEWLYREYSPALKAKRIPFEFIYVVEPWGVDLTAPLHDLIHQGEPIRIFEVGSAVGESMMLEAALQQSHGSTLLTLPAYPSILPEGLTNLVAAVEEGADLASACRTPDSRSLVNRIQNRAFHTLLRSAVGGSFRDIGSGVRAMRREVLELVPVHGDFFRFLPVLAERHGFRVEELSIARHPDDSRTRIYPPGVYARRLIDLLGLLFLVRFTRKPLRFFGLIGSLLAGIGAVVLAVLLVQRLGGQGIADRPLLLLGVLLVVLGMQAIGIGLIGEIIVHLSEGGGRREYRVREEPVLRGLPEQSSDP